MKKNILFFITICALISACRCNKNKGDTTIKLDSLQTAHGIREDDSTLIYDAALNIWIGENLQQPHWQWSHFSLAEFWATDSTEKKAYTTAKDFYTKYASVLKWSVDSNYILDIGSYGSVILKDAKGNIHLAKGEPDTEITMLYPKEHKKMRILFSGPSTHVINATWIDSNDVAMLGVFAANDTLRADTLLWIIDAKQNFFRQYKWKK